MRSISFYGCSAFITLSSIFLGCDGTSHKQVETPPKRTKLEEQPSAEEGFLPVFDQDYPQNVVTNRMEKNFTRYKDSLPADSFLKFRSAGLEVYEPKGLTVAERFTGFFNKQNGVSFVVLTNPFSMRQTTSQIVAEAVRSGQTAIMFTRKVKVGGKEGVFYLTREPVQKRIIAKYILAFGDEKFSWILSSTFRPDLEPEFGEELMKLMLNVRLSEDERSPPGEDVNFKLQPNRLVITPGFVDKVVYTRNGVFPTDKATEPIFQAGRAVVDFDVQDRIKFARKLISPSPAFAVNVVSSEKEITIGGLDGFEFVAVGHDTIADQPLVIYSVTLFDNKDGYVMHGWVSSDNTENYLSDFRDLAKSFQLKEDWKK